MFVINEDCEILNLAQCIKIVVIKSEIKAYAPVWDSARSTHLIAKFDTDVIQRILNSKKPLLT